MKSGLMSSRKLVATPVQQKQKQTLEKKPPNSLFSRFTGGLVYLNLGSLF